jgi:hypothetical protein
MQEGDFREVWVELPDGQSMCALINGEVGWLMYLRYNGDAGFSSRNPAYGGDTSRMIEYVLSNGQRDEYPASWALQRSVIDGALQYFRDNGRPPPFVRWHNDTGDGTEVEFLDSV